MEQDMSENNRMRTGRITQTVWRRSVGKRIRTGHDRSMFEPSPWEMCSGFKTGTDNGYVWADAHVSGNDGRTGYYAVYHAAGELAARGVRPQGAAIQVLFEPGCTEDELQEIADGAQSACRELGIQITAFQGEVTASVREKVVFASAAGKLSADSSVHGKGGQNRGYGNLRLQGKKHREIVQCGYAGLEGTLRILGETREKLEQRFVSAFLDRTETMTDQLVRTDQLLKICECDGTAQVRHMGSGGILAALWELADTVQTGFEIDMSHITLKQETVEICEFYRLNPYLMTSAGSYLILTEEAEAVIHALEETGARTVRLGTVTDGNARIIRNGEDVRYLDRPATDELERWKTERP